MPFGALGHPASSCSHWTPYQCSNSVNQLGALFTLVGSPSLVVKQGRFGLTHWAWHLLFTLSSAIRRTSPSLFAVASPLLVLQGVEIDAAIASRHRTLAVSNERHVRWSTAVFRSRPRERSSERDLRPSSRRDGFGVCCDVPQDQTFAYRCAQYPIPLGPFWMKVGSVAGLSISKK